MPFWMSLLGFYRNLVIVDRKELYLRQHVSSEKIFNLYLFSFSMILVKYKNIKLLFGQRRENE